MTSQTRTTPDRIGRATAGSLIGALLCVAGGLVAAPAGASPVPPVPVSVTLTAVGETAFRVPAGVTSLHVVVIGGHGGQSFFGLGGSGAKVVADLSVKPDDVLYTEVAADGGDLVPGSTDPGEGFGVGTDGLGGTGGTGFGSGGRGSQGVWYDTDSRRFFFTGGGGGGGASAIVSCPVSDSACSPVPLVIAGGGGGGGYNSAGGDGGTPIGANGGGSGTLVSSGTVVLFGGEGGQQDRAGICAGANLPSRYCSAPPDPRNGSDGLWDFGPPPLSYISAGGGGGGHFGGGGGLGSRFADVAETVGGGGGGGSSLVPDGGIVTAGQGHGAAAVTISYLPPDTTEPVITTPDGLTVEATGAAGAVVPFPAGAHDANEAELAVTCDHASGTTFPLGRTDVTCSARGINGITAQRTFSVTVVDTTAPVVAAHDDITVSWKGTDAVVEYTSPTATDTVDGDLPVTCVPASGSPFRRGKTEVSCAATDAAGNTGRGTFAVLVNDDTPPVISTPGDQIAEATTGDGATVSFSVTAVDSAGTAAEVRCDHASGATFPVGATTVVCSATGGNGIAGEGSFTITVRDTTPPVIAVHADVDLSRSAPAAVDFGTPVASDTVDGSVPVTCTPASGSTFPLGATTVTCAARDAAGNRAGSTFTVRVTAPPVQVPGAPGIGAATAGNGRATVAFTPPSSTGGAPVTGYLVTATPGGRTATGTAGPITVTGLTNGTSYRFTVQAINSAGTGPSSALSNAVTPAAPPTRADVRVTVTGPASVRSGGTATYTLTVTNAGPSTAVGLVAALDTTGLSRTSAGVTPVSASAATAQFYPGDYRWSLRPLASGATVTLRVTGTVSVRAGQPSGARGGAVATTTDPDAHNNVAAVSTRVTV